MNYLCSDLKLLTCSAAHYFHWVQFFDQKVPGNFIQYSKERNDLRFRKVLVIKFFT